MDPAYRQKKSKAQNCTLSEVEFIPITYFQKFLDVFEAIEQKISNGGVNFEVFTIGNKVKSEVKEELLVKAEKGERSKAFSSFVTLITGISVEVYSMFESIKSTVMETYGQVDGSDQKDMAFISHTFD